MIMDDPRDKPPIDLTSVETLNNLDTARMALRWALERLRLLERHNADLARKAEWEQKMRLQSESESKNLWEMEKNHLTETLRARETRLDDEYHAKAARNKREFEELSAQIRSEAQARLQAAETALADKEESLNTLNAEIQKRETQLAAREHEFERFCALQRSSVETDRRRIREEAEARAQSALAEVQRATEKRMEVLEETYAREKAMLSEEAQSWRLAASENIPAPQLRQRADAAKERLKSVEDILRERTLAFERLERAWQEERTRTEEDLKAWRRRYEEAAKKQSDAEKALAELSGAFEEARGREKFQDKLLGQLEESWSQEKARLHEEADHLKEELARNAEDARSWKSRCEEITAGKSQTEKALAALQGAFEETRVRESASDNDLAQWKSSWTEEKKRLQEDMDRLCTELNALRGQAAHAQAIHQQQTENERRLQEREAENIRREKELVKTYRAKRRELETLKREAEINLRRLADGPAS